MTSEARAALRQERLSHNSEEGITQPAPKKEKVKRGFVWPKKGAPEDGR